MRRREQAPSCPRRLAGRIRLRRRLGRPEPRTVRSGRPLDHASDGWPVFRLTREESIEHNDEWFHANRNRLDLILDYARHQLRIPLGRHYAPVETKFVEEITREIPEAHSDAALFIGLASAFQIVGDKDNAVKDLLRAIRLEPKNADACFNLAVLYAVPTNQPADKVSARMWYDRALQFGAERDSSLEELMK